MKKYLIAVLFGVICLAGTAAYVNTKISKAPIESFIVKESDAFLYVNNSKEYREATKEFNKEMMAKLLDFNKKLGVENPEDAKEMEKLNKLSETIGKIIIVHTEQDIRKVKKADDLSLFVILETTDELKKEIETRKDSIEKTDDGFYKFKYEDKGLDKAAEISKDENLAKLAEEKVDIYFTEFKGYIVAGTSKENIKAYLKKVEAGVKNKELTEEYTKNSKNIMYSVVDIAKIMEKAEFKLPKNDYVESLKYGKIYTTYNIAKKEYYVAYEVTGEGSLFKIMDSSKLKDRKLAKYVDINSIYFSNNSFRAVGEYIITQASKTKNGAMYPAMAAGMVGEPLPDYMGNIGDEILVNYNAENNSVAAVLNVKDEKRFEKSLQYIQMQKNKDGSYSRMYDEKNKLTVKNNKIYFNGPINKEGKLAKEITADTFLYSKLDFTPFKMLFPALEGATITMRGRATGKNIVLEGIMNEESYKKVITFALEEAGKEGSRLFPQSQPEYQYEEDTTTESEITTEAAVEEVQE